MPVAKDTDARWKENHITVFKRYSEGMIHSERQSSWGMRCGLYHKMVSGRRMYLPLVLCGPMQIGLTTHDVFVCCKHKWVFLGRNGRIWRLEGMRLPKKAATLSDMVREGIIIWADTLCRLIVDRLTPERITEPMHQACQRYRHICRELVQKRIMDSASMGRKRGMEYYAKAVSPDWTKGDLVTPRVPNVQHAVLFSLVLALESNTASDLIELAAFIEHRLPLYNRQACQAIYQSSVELLAKLCPAWWAQSFLCPWHTVGSIEQLFKAQFCRIVNDSWVREVPIEAVTGLEVNIDINPETRVLMDDDNARPIEEWGYDDRQPVELHEIETNPRSF